MKQVLLNNYRFNLAYARALVAGVSEEQMTHSPSPGLENHPAFTLGHLISGSALMSRYLGGPYDMKPEWERLFKRKGPGDPRYPETDTALYPEKEALLQELERQHLLVEGLIQELDEARLQETAKWRFSQHMPTMGDLLHFMCITHEATHLSQLAAWRRAMGFPSALATL